MNPRCWSFETAVRTLWQEARGETDDGRAAVAHVIWNRVASGRWGTSLASVCLWPKQFSGWNDDASSRVEAAQIPDDDPTLERLRVTLAWAQNAPDPTDGAMFYYAVSIAEPEWARHMICAGLFGAQKFFREK